MDKDVAFALRQIVATNTPVAKQARKSGISTSTYYRWRKAYNERRPVNPQLPTIKFAMRALGFQFQWLTQEEAASFKTGQK